MTLTKTMNISSSEITPEQLYLSRREFIKTAGLLGAGAAALAACSPSGGSRPVDFSTGEEPKALSATDELDEPLTSYHDITNYNNYYEFSTDKAAVAPLSKDFPISPWTVAVGGLVRNPMSFDVDDLKTRFAPEERVYRLRCVEGWSMVIPWIGFPLHKLLAVVEPLSEAKFVRFEAVYDPEKMPGQKARWYEWPYIEGLRMDEALNDLTLMTTGLYGKDLVQPNGAPLRLAVPWKYGFKSIKAIVKIDLVEEMPVSLWMAAAPSEYGFYSNVDPTVPHPRWSQASERRIGEIARRPTLLYNGYAEQVAHMYHGAEDQRENS
ncbi:MAG TPA: protein-methionine-sulfoxide reductase catalytic subunit MsrP [Anaerolineales bacterium]|nr:protein-methionine-sulfoxide reductase catalytic subunit MsrP [Anaerolineales bacterium]